MRRHWTAALLFLVAMPLALVLPAAAERSVADDLPRSYVGSFEWDGGVELQSVVISFRSVNGVGTDTVAAEGCGAYYASGRVTIIRIKMTVRLPDLAVTIAELDPIDESGFVVDGRHTGYFSADLQAIDATWTTRQTGERGRLRLYAAPGVECEPLHESLGVHATVPVATLRRATPTADEHRRPSP